MPNYSKRFFVPFVGKKIQDRYQREESARLGGKFLLQ